MSLRYLELTSLAYIAKSALKTELLLTAAVTIVGVVVLVGLFGMGGDASFSSILGDFFIISGSTLWLMLGLVALAHQLNTTVICNEGVVSTPSAFVFAWYRLKVILLLPAWGVGVLLAILLGEVVALSLANIPGLGVVWLALLVVPLLIFNTLVAMLLMFSVFNVAAYVAISEANAAEMRVELWDLIKKNFVELVVYNLGGVLLTLVIAALVLSPLWLGAQATLAIMDYAASDPWRYLVEATGFWGSIAHLIGLIMSGLLLAVIAAIPIVILTHITLLVHIGLSVDDSSEG